MSSRIRINDKNERRALILAAAVKVARRTSFAELTRDAVAKEAGVSPALIGHVCGTMKNFKRDVMRHAVDHAIVEIVAHGLAAKHPIAMKAPQDLKQLASQHIAGV